jgi:RNA polymerase sigma-70 factor (ECF subfamily)
MGLLSQRDLRAFEAIYDRYNAVVYSTALRVIGDASLAEDVTQEIFLRLWRQPDRYVASRGRFLSWIISVSRNRSLDEIRRRGRRQRYESASPEQQEREFPAGDANDPSRLALAADDRDRIREALALLPPEQKQVLELAYFHGLTQQEIAEKLEQPLGTVKTRIRLGMQKLRVWLKETLEQTEA